MHKVLYLFFALTGGILPFSFIAGAAASEAELWNKLADGGLVVLMRHTSTVTGGDVGGSLIRDPSCARERNLSSKGIDEAIQIGKMFASKGIPVKNVLASPYCRTVDTAKFAFGRVDPTGFLSLIETMPHSQAEAATKQLNQRIGSYSGSENLVMITHAPNINAVAFDPVEKGAFLVLKPMGNGDFEELGKMNLFK